MNNPALVLVVEDDLLIQLVMREALADAGYAVMLASTGDEAVATLGVSGAAIRALITDVELPPGTLTGWDVARHARAIVPALPVVYMTGASGGDWPSRGVSRSVLVPKPFAPAKLLAAVRQLLNAGSPGVG